MRHLPNGRCRIFHWQNQMYSALVEVSDKLILKMLHISPPNGKVAAIRQVQSPTALFANVGKIYEKAVVAAAKK